MSSVIEYRIKWLQAKLAGTDINSISRRRLEDELRRLLDEQKPPAPYPYGTP
jgi:hypothetical protein